MDRPYPCRGCVLDSKAFGYAPAVGPASASIFFMGEALGYDEALQGQPFVGAAGALLNRVLHLNHIPRESLRIDNLCRCQPPGNYLDNAPWEWEAINTCKRNYRDQSIEEWLRTDPSPNKTLVTLGAIPLRNILNLPKGGVRVQDFHGTVQRDPTDRFWVVPTYHPSYIQRGAFNLIGVMSYDLQIATEVAAQGYPTPRETYFTDPVELVLDPSPEWFAQWAANYILAVGRDPEGVWLAVDIETPDKAKKTDEGELTVTKDRSYQITRINFSCSTSEGITVPFMGPYLEIIGRVLSTQAPKALWNAAYDVPRLRYNHIPIEGQILDFMWAWHVLQSDLPRGLGFVAPFYCLAAGERVRLWDGRSLKVSDIVTTKADVTVLGCDDAGAPIPLKITNWFQAEQAGQRWLAVKISNATQVLHCTPEHRVWTTNVQWQEAQALRVGDMVPIPRAGNNSLIHGTLLGDGCVDKTGWLAFSHTEKDAAWTEVKARVFAPEWKRRGGPRLTWRKGTTGAIKSSNGRTYPFKSGRQLRCGVGIGKWWRDRFYTPDGKIFLPPPDFKAVAVWYGDDGCLAHTGETYNPRIYTAGFLGGYRGPLAWAEALFGVGNVSVYGRGSSTECIALIGDGAAQFFVEVSKWLHPVMDRKLPPYLRGRYIEWMRPGFQFGVVERVEPWQPEKKWHRRNNIRYCIEVDHPSHRYFTSGGLVSNSSFGPWKHLNSSDPVRYAAIDGVQTLRIAHGVIRDLQTQGMEDIFWRHVVDLDTLALHPAEEVGLPIDTVELEKLRVRLQGHHDRIHGEVQAYVPQELLPLVPKSGLTEKPEDLCSNISCGRDNPHYHKIVEHTVPRLVKVCKTCGAAEITKTHRCQDRTLTPQVTSEELQVVRFYRQEEFNPGSSQQLLAFMRHFHLKPGKDKKTKKDSANRECVERLAKSAKAPLDQFFQGVLDLKSVDKILTTYVNGSFRKLKEDPRSILDGRLHPTFLHKPSTLRLSCQSPNLQNVVADRAGGESLAAGFRNCIVASPGAVLLETDFSGIEAVLTGWFCGDPSYIRLAKLGIHAFVASHLVGDPADAAWDDDRLRQHLKHIKEGHPYEYNQCKRCVHGCVPGDHEVLTPAGWVRFDQLQDGVEVAQWDAGKITFVQPMVTRTQGCGSMIRIAGRGISVNMTHDHRVPLRIAQTAEVRAVPADSLPSQGRVPVSGVLSGDYDLPNRLRLAAAIQADGRKGHPNGTYQVFHFVRPRKIERLKHLLDIERILYREVACRCHPNRGVRISFTWDTSEYLEDKRRFLLAPLLRLRPKERCAFLQELLLWDGTGRDKKSGTQQAYITTEKHNAIVVQTVAHLSGQQSLLRTLCREGRKPLYRVSFNNRKWARLENAVVLPLTETPQPIYCVTVPSSYFLVRHNDTISVTGNTNYGLTERGMVLQFPKEFPTMAAARKVREIYFKVAPSLPAFQLQVRERAHKDGYLGGPGDHPFGYKHWFFNVMNYRPVRGVAPHGAMITRIGGRNYQVALGEDAKRAVAFYPQSTAAGVLAEVILRLFTPGYESYIGDAFYGRTPLIAPIHDSLLLEVPEEQVERVVAAVVREMTRPISQLPLPAAWGMGDYLSIGVEIKQGKNWASYDEQHNPQGMRVLSFVGAGLGAGLAADSVIPVDEYDEDLDEEEVEGLKSAS